MQTPANRRMVQNSLRIMTTNLPSNEMSVAGFKTGVGSARGDQRPRSDAAPDIY